MTRQINYYNLDDELHFVDLLGYGYAAVSKGEKNLWAKVIEEYLNVRPQLYLVLLLLDIRHKPSKDDENMYRWILASGLAYLIVATKSDKISRQQLQHNTALIRSTLQIPPNKDIICVSAEKRTGIEALWDADRRIHNGRGGSNKMKEAFITKEQAEEISRKYPTPFYIYSEAGIRSAVRGLNRLFLESGIPGSILRSRRARIHF